MLLVVCLLSACNSTPIKSTRISTNQALQVNHGIVAVQVINNAERLGTWHKGWTEIIMFRLDNIDAKKQLARDIADSKSQNKNTKKISDEDLEWEPDFYTLTPHNQGVIDSQIFVGTVPEGEYIISSLYSYYNGGDFTSWISMPVMHSAGKFKVKNSRLTNLGSLVFQPLLNIKQSNFWSTSTNQRAFVTRISKQQKLDKYILDHYPNIQKQVDLSEVLSWENDDLNEFRVNLSKLSRDNAYGDKTIAIEHHGQNIIASKFGLLKWQDNQGAWHKSSIDSNSQLSAAIETKDTIAIGGELGQVFISNSLQGPWQRQTPISPKEAIIWFGKNSTSSYSMTQTMNDYLVYSFQEVGDTWTEIGKFKRKPSSFFVQNGGVFSFISSKGMVTIINDNKKYSYDEGAKRWMEEKTAALVDMKPLQHGVLVGIEVSQWDGVGDQVISMDDGDTWLDVSRQLDIFSDNKTDLSLPIVTMQERVVTLGRMKVLMDKNKQSRSKKITSKLMLISAKTSDISKKSQWKTHGKAKKGCHTALPQLTHDSEIYFLCDRGDVVVTKDYGVSWQQVVKIETEAMQNNYEKMLKALKDQKPN